MVSQDRLVRSTALLLIVWLQDLSGTSLEVPVSTCLTLLHLSCLQNQSTWRTLPILLSLWEVALPFWVTVTVVFVRLWGQPWENKSPGGSFSSGVSLQQPSPQWLPSFKWICIFTGWSLWWMDLALRAPFLLFQHRTLGFPLMGIIYLTITAAFPQSCL